MHPFVAGFGNRQTDVVAYQRVGIPPSRVFVVNPNSELSITSMRTSFRGTVCVRVCVVVVVAAAAARTARMLALLACACCLFRG